MSNKESAKVVSSGIIPDEDPHAKVGHRGFQSKQAMEQAVARPTDEEGSDEPPLAEVSDFNESRLPSKAVSEDMTKLVRVRPRENIAPFRYGPKMYALEANKPVLVPLYVKRHLEEKNLL